MTFADDVIRFNRELLYDGDPLPPGIKIMNPFKEMSQTMPIVEAFYRKFYDDNKTRRIILGINPGRFGAGLTGIPFTDTKRLVTECAINYTHKITHEPSSVFVYEVIRAYGGPEAFYKDFFIHSACPLGFVSIDKNGRVKNYNYYDSKELLKAVKEYIIQNIKKLVSMNIHTDTCFCFGTGKNEKFLRELNEEHKFFKEIIPLEHPRYIMQYKSKSKDIYINKYLEAFKNSTREGETSSSMRTFS